MCSSEHVLSLISLSAFVCQRKNVKRFFVKMIITDKFMAEEKCKFKNCLCNRRGEVNSTVFRVILVSLSFLSSRVNFNSTAASVLDAGRGVDQVLLRLLRLIKHKRYVYS